MKEVLFELPDLADCPEAIWVLASRRSRLAQAQAVLVARELMALVDAPNPIAAHWVETRGDLILDRPLKQVGGKGLFTKSVDQALIDKKARLAVHSAKDLPAQLDPALVLAAFPQRDSRLDVLVSNQFERIEDLPEGAKVGTASQRRAALLKALHPWLHVELIRGNLDTRLAKLDAGEYDALILAEAGLKRLGLETRIRQVLPPTRFVPAGGQGALAVTARREDAEALALLQRLDDPLTRMALSAERHLIERLGADCQQPLGVNAYFHKGARARSVVLDVFYAQEDLSAPRWLRFEGEPDDLMAFAEQAALAVESGAGSPEPLG